MGYCGVCGLDWMDSELSMLETKKRHDKHIHRKSGISVDAGSLCGYSGISSGRRDLLCLEINYLCRCLP